MEGSHQSICEETVFRKVYEEQSRDLYKFLYYKYGAENHPEDLMQEAFAKLWDNCKKVSIERARAFLFTVANNRMLNDLERKKTALNYQKEDRNSQTSESPHYILEENEFMGRLQKAIEDLTEEQRVAFLLNRVDGKKHKEIAEILGISQKAVEKRIYKALEVLQQKVGNI